MHIKMSEQIDQLAPALVKAINAIEGVTKDNEAGGGSKKYRYADLTACIEEAKRALGLHGLTVLQPPVSPMGYFAGEGQRSTPMVATIILHESGQWMAGEIVVPDFQYQVMSGAQAMGSTITYMRRYSLCSMLSIPMEDDDGASAAPRPQGQRYDQRDDRRPASNGARHAPFDAQPSPADRIAGNAARQPAARPARRDEPPIESYGEPPMRGR